MILKAIGLHRNQKCFLLSPVYKHLMIHTGKNLCFIEFSTKIHWNKWLAASDVFRMSTQWIKFFIFYYHRCLKNVIPQIDSKNEWLLLSVIFTVKLELVFVLLVFFLAFENAFSQSFHFKANIKSIYSSTKRY